ncbi:MAG: hypothetical protein H6767_00895 [Candidatus Peribacteria bacterium]|nr:MAG: hypothetical protein H6767_00895 [Candidatus Peribacteria bacterium]
MIPDKKLSEHSVDEITRIREWNNTPWYNSYTGKKKIFYGHWAIDGIRIRKKTIGLDSGCCYGKALSAYIVETKELIQYPAQHIYVDIYKSSKKTLWQRIFGLPKHEL